MDDHYLNNPLFSIRHHIALYYLDDGEDIIDVGCGSTPLYKFTDPSKFNSIVCVDPLLVIEDVPSNVSLYKCGLDKYVLEVPPTSIVLMGFDWRGTTIVDDVCELAPLSRRVIVETSKWKATLSGLHDLVGKIDKLNYTRVVSIDVGFSNNKVFGSWNNCEHLDRLFEVYEKKEV